MKLLWTFLLGSTSLWAQFSPGDIAFVAYNCDSTDGFAIVLMREWPANSTIYFTDDEWNGLDIGSGGDFVDHNEGAISWTSPGNIIESGTIILFKGTNNTSNSDYGVSHGSISGTINLNSSDEVLYAFEGPSDEEATAFLGAIANDGFSSTKGEITGTGLSVDTTAISFSDDEDVLLYTGPTQCDSTPSSCLEKINDPANWVSESGSGDQSGNSNYPDFPDNVSSDFNGTALSLLIRQFRIESLPSNMFEISFELASEGVESPELFVASNSMLWKKQEYRCEKGKCRTEVSLQAPILYSKLEWNDDGEMKSIIIAKRNITENCLLPYPNPAQDELYFDASNYEWVIFDMNGRMVLNSKDHQPTNNGANPINTGGLDVGTYQLKVGNQCYKIEIAR